MKKYKQLTREQRSQIFALLQRKTAKKIIAEIIGCSLSTIYREIKRNSTPKGNYLWDKAHEKAMARRKRSYANSKLSDILVWRITIKTITTDNEPEFADHLTITKKIGVKVYFAHPYSSWQKGCIENTNKLIRQYIPKKSNFNDFSGGFIKRCRKRLI